MYPFVRLWRVLRQARRSAPIGLFEESRITVRVWPQDIDVFNELNNGRTATLYDLGRFDLSARTGLLDAAQDRNWGLAVAGATIRFRRRVRMWEKVEIRTRLEGVEGLWGYIAQSMWRGREPCSSILVRIAVTDRTGALPMDGVMEAVGHAGPLPDLPDWVVAWIDADGGRPWPPGERPS